MLKSVPRPSPALIVAIVALVMAMSGGAYAATQSSATQPTTPKPAPAPLPESSRYCTPTLCIDADPESGGSGGFGYNAAQHKAVTTLTVGQTYPFTVTVVQDGSQNANGSITLTWNPADFSGPTAGSDTSAQCASASTGNAMSCTYTDLAHQYKSDSFNFKAIHTDANAHVDVTVEVAGEEASAEFPVRIS